MWVQVIAAIASVTIGKKNTKAVRTIYGLAPENLNPHFAYVIDSGCKFLC